MVMFLCMLSLFFYFFPIDISSSSIFILARAPITLSLTRAFLSGITSGSFPFSSPLASRWITLTNILPISLGNGGEIVAAACGGCLKICG